MLTDVYFLFRSPFFTIPDDVKYNTKTLIKKSLNAIKKPHYLYTHIVCYTMADRIQPFIDCPKYAIRKPSSWETCLKKISLNGNLYKYKSVWKGFINQYKCVNLYCFIIILFYSFHFITQKILFPSQTFIILVCNLLIYVSINLIIRKPLIGWYVYTFLQ